MKPKCKMQNSTEKHDLTCNVYGEVPTTSIIICKDTTVSKIDNNGKYKKIDDCKETTEEFYCGKCYLAKDYFNNN